MDRTVQAAAIFFLIALSGCTQIPQNAQPPASGQNTALSECITICKNQKAIGIDFNNGPCIANPLQETPDTVCDIAHNPRQAVDNQPENQCSAFREGKATHFVELDQKCTLIKRA